MIDNRDLFEYFVEYCKQHSLEEIIAEFGGGQIYIPSYKTTYRDKEIYTLYTKGKSIKYIKKHFSLSESRIRSIIKEQKNIQTAKEN